MIQSVFSHIGITAKDPENLEKFYSTFFGFKRVRVYNAGPEQIVMLKKDNIYFEIFKATENRPHPSIKETGPLYPSLRHLCFAVDNIEETLSHLKNIEITAGPKDLGHLILGMRAVWIADPEGNIIELLQGYNDN